MRISDWSSDVCSSDLELVRRVRTSGEIKWRNSMVFISEALIGEAVGLREREDGHWLIRFADVPLVLIDRYTGKLSRFGPGRPPRPQAPPGRPAWRDRGCQYVSLSGVTVSRNKKKQKKN